jgi:hypothetical protein
MQDDRMHSAKLHVGQTAITCGEVEPRPVASDRPRDAVADGHASQGAVSCVTHNDRINIGVVRDVCRSVVACVAFRAVGQVAVLSSPKNRLNAERRQRRLKEGVLRIVRYNELSTSGEGHHGDANRMRESRRHRRCQPYERIRLTGLVPCKG